MARQKDTRQLMVDAAIALLRERGAGSVTMDAVLARSGAPRGSAYHHFPGGRDELVLTAVQQAGDSISKLIDRATQDGDPLGSLQLFTTMWQHVLAEGNYATGCAVVALAIDNRENLPEAGELVRGIFSRWQGAFTDLMTRSGYPPDRAGRLSALAVAAVEGGVILCRVHRSPAPLNDVITELAPLFS